MQAHDVGKGGGLRHSEEGAGQPRQAGRDDEHGRLVAPHVVADEARARLVLLDGLQHAAERRMDEAPEQQGYDDEDASTK